MKWITLGTSHGAPEKGRACSGNLLQVNGAYYLFDCGGSVESKMVDLGLDFTAMRCAFITHMHEDHVGSLSGIAKHFSGYLYTNDAHLNIYFPEKVGLDAFQAWLAALHCSQPPKRQSYYVVETGEIYHDENIAVTAIRTDHLKNGEFPSFAYMIETADQRVLYTGDLAADFHDYPAVTTEKDFDAIVCELVHFDFEKNLDTLAASRTKQLIFTHVWLTNIPKIEANRDHFPFPVTVAEDHKVFEI